MAHGADHTPETSNACPDPDPNCDSHLGFTWLLQVINRTRDLARMIVGIIPDDTIEGGVHARMVGYVVAFCITMKVSWDACMSQVLVDARFESALRTTVN